MVLAHWAGVALAAFLVFAEPFSFQYPSTTDRAGHASLAITANEPMKAFEVVVRGDNQEIRRSVPSLASGRTYDVSWVQSSVRAKYELEIKGRGMGANFGFEIQKPVAVGRIGKLQSVSSREDIVTRGTCTFRTPFDVTHYAYKVYDLEGDVVASRADGGAVEAGGRLTFDWDPIHDIFMIWVRAEGSAGQFAEHKLVPWAVEIPHSEINFDTGQATIKSGEAPKLDEALAVAFHELAAIERVNEVVGGTLAPRLYIVGYTDTVGSHRSNETLSHARARSIAGYFHEKGIWAEINYAGMGERGLAVDTGDNVDEVRNRRALYLIALNGPPSNAKIPKRWTKFADHRARPLGFQLPPLPEQWKQYRARKKEERSSARPDMSEALPHAGEVHTSPSAAVNMPNGSLDDDHPVAEPNPPPLEGAPGATASGCSMTGRLRALPSMGMMALVMMLALRGRRARGSIGSRPVVRSSRPEMTVHA